MKILVLSDSHGNVDNMVQAVTHTAPDWILHLGDVMADGEKLHAMFPEIPFEQVPGNCDYGAFDAPCWEPCMPLRSSKRIFSCSATPIKSFPKRETVWPCLIPAASEIIAIPPTVL